MTFKENEIPNFHENERAHKLAANAFRILRNLNVESQMHVFKALDPLFKDPRSKSNAQLRSINALERWLTEHDLMHSLVAARADQDVANADDAEDLATEEKRRSTRAYEEWRSAQDSPKSWPSTATIRRAFGGSWNTALASVIAQPEPMFRSQRRIARGQEFTDAELIQALQDWAQSTTGKLRWGGYRAWALEQRSAGRRLPLNEATFTNRFGSRREAFERAGIWSDRAATSKDRVPDYSRESLLDAIGFALDSMSGRLTMGKYSAFRELCKARGVFLPCDVLIKNRIGEGSWKTALAIYRAERAPGDDRLGRGVLGDRT